VLVSTWAMYASAMASYSVPVEFDSDKWDGGGVMEFRHDYNIRSSKPAAVQSGEPRTGILQ